MTTWNCASGTTSPCTGPTATTSVPGTGRRWPPPVPARDLHAFVHGNAEMIKDLRRYLFLESGVDRANVSISGYWRTGQTEDDWQAGKRAFNEAMEAEEAAAEQSSAPE